MVFAEGNTLRIPQVPTISLGPDPKSTSPVQLSAEEKRTDASAQGAIKALPEVDCKKLVERAFSWENSLYA